MTNRDWDGMPPGAVIRALRTERGWTQRELAVRAGIGGDGPSVSKIENGRENPGWERAYKLAAALEVDPNLLLPPAHTQHTIQDVLNRLEEQSTERDVALDALAASLVAIGAQLHRIEVELRRLGGRGQTGEQ